MQSRYNTFPESYHTFFSSDSTHSTQHSLIFWQTSSIPRPNRCFLKLKPHFSSVQRNGADLQRRMIQVMSRSGNFTLQIIPWSPRSYVVYLLIMYLFLTIEILAFWTLIIIQ